MTPLDLFFSFWWLIFPIMGFAFAGFGMLLRHRQNQKALDILKAYAEQGKDPPPEVVRAVYGGDPTAPPSGAPGAPGYGPGYGPWGWGGPWGGLWGGWGWRSYYRWGPYWAWRRFIIFAALAAGFAAAHHYGDFAEGGYAFVIVAIIMGALALASLLTAVVQTLWRPK